MDLDQTTVLIGENNCGKTSILEAIRLCLSRAVRGNPFEDQDHHLDSSTSAPGDAGPINVVVDFAETKSGDWPPELIQALSDAVVFDNSGLYHVIFSVTCSYDSTLKDFTSTWDFLDPTGKALVKAKRSTTLSTFQSLFNVSTLPPYEILLGISAPSLPSGSLFA